jgi:PKD repeat protein
MSGLHSYLSLALLGATCTALTACGEDSQAPPSHPEAPPGQEAPAGSTLAPVDLIYVCGNRFLATNATRTPVRVVYRVLGTGERGSLTLREGLIAQDQGQSETELETAEQGTVELYRDDEPVARRRNEGRRCGAPAMSASVAAAGDEGMAGSWTPPFTWPVVALQLSLLPNGHVLSWGHAGTPQVWDPATGEFTSVPSPSLLFCSGHSFLPDGRLLVTGGHIADGLGLPNTNLFNPSSETWSASVPMQRGRWYPTNTTLASGDVVILAGTDENGVAVPQPEVWSRGTVRPLIGASRTFQDYPRAFLAPDGRVYYAGEEQMTRYLDPTGAGSWTAAGNRLYGVRDYGAAVMYDKGKILYVGGGRTTNTAEIVDLNSAAPAWQWTGSMAFPRRHLNATVLPTGDVLVTGGSSGTAFDDVAAAVHAAELWSPATGVWTTLASNSINRVYHSTSILLPDGRVLHAGSGDGSGAPNERSAELYSPPYLFKGPQPSITGAPSIVGYGTTFTITTPQADDIGKVSLIRLGSTTHAFDMNQRFQWLSFTHGAGSLAVTAPTSRNDAPPGHYMVFALDASGVPSKAVIIRLGTDSELEPPANQAPVADFSSSCGGLVCTFTDRSFDPDGNVIGWSWTFGDGSTSSARSPSRTYAAGGTYPVGLTVTDNDGATHQRSGSVTVGSGIALNVTGRTDATKQYMTLLWSGATGTTVDVYRDGRFLNNQVNDGKYINTHGLPGAASYAYKVCQPATTNCSNSATVTFSGAPPLNQVPVADFSSSCAGLACTFSDRSADPDGSVSGWSWTFGDGAGSTVRSPSHSYATAGTYAISLTVADNLGATGQRSGSVAVPQTIAISLSVTGRTDATKQYMTLLWSGARSPTVDVYRDGRLLTNQLNDGKYINTHALPGAASYAYKVCEAGTTTCSNSVTVVLR